MGKKINVQTFKQSQSATEVFYKNVVRMDECEVANLIKRSYRNILTAKTSCGEVIVKRANGYAPEKMQEGVELFNKVLAKKPHVCFFGYEVQCYIADNSPIFIDYAEYERLQQLNNDTEKQ